MYIAVKAVKKKEGVHNLQFLSSQKKVEVIFEKSRVRTEGLWYKWVVCNYCFRDFSMKLLKKKNRKELLS